MASKETVNSKLESQFIEGSEVLAQSQRRYNDDSGYMGIRAREQFVLASRLVGAEAANVLSRYDTAPGNNHGATG